MSSFIKFNKYVENIKITIDKFRGMGYNTNRKDGGITMEKIILKSLTAENFASFAEKISFSTEIDSSKKDDFSALFEAADCYFNKVSYMYGANGSGKTFFCKIIREIQRLLNFSPLTVGNHSQILSLPQFKGINDPVKTFAFDTAYSDKPSSFSLDIVICKTTYHYEFSIKGNEIIYELLTKKYRRTEKLLERTSSSFKDILLYSEMKDFEDQKKIVKENALCLPVAAIFNNSLADTIVKGINQIQVVNMTAGRIDPTNDKESFSDERINKYVKILQKADPTLRNMKISFEEEEMGRQKISSDDFENREIIAMKTTVGIETKHAVFENGAETCDTSISFFADESLGTVKLFTTLPYLYDALETGGVLVIDEIENGLHLSLAKEIINLFLDPNTNPNNAQLICTSHQPLLISENARRDQVWLANKDSFGKSKLHRLSDMKFSRAKINISNHIINDAFGFNPMSFFK